MRNWTRRFREVRTGPSSGQFRAEPLVSENPADDGERYFLNRVGAATRFEERDGLLEMVGRLRENDDKFQLLAGFAGSGGEAAGWLLGMRKSGELKGVLAGGSLLDLDKVVLEVAALDLEQRLEILRADPDFPQESRQELVDWLTGRMWCRLLEDGRDWRYEFRNGTASLEDVLHALRRRPAASGGGGAAGGLIPASSRRRIRRRRCRCWMAFHRRSAVRYCSIPPG